MTTERSEWVNRDELLNLLWCNIWVRELDPKEKAQAALAYCEARNLAFHNTKTLMGAIKAGEIQ